MTSILQVKINDVMKASAKDVGYTAIIYTKIGLGLNIPMMVL